MICPHCVTVAENTRRGLCGEVMKTHCIRGHLLSEGHIRSKSNGRWRACVVCHNANQRKHYHRRKVKEAWAGLELVIEIANLRCPDAQA